MTGALTVTGDRVTTEVAAGPLQVPFFNVAGQSVWGATAMMLSELLALGAMRFAPGGAG